MNKKNNKRHQAVIKAWKTIRARQAFFNRYGKTAAIAVDLITGYSAPQVAYRNDTTRGTVAAVMANLRRGGTYRNMAKACKY